MKPKEIIDEFIEKNLKLVRERPDIAESQSGTESESSKDYTGRVVFEFFQNAIDRAESNVWLELFEDRFIISNDGKAFSIQKQNNDKFEKSDFHALNTIHNSNKKAGESVGNKGVGFKSCWNVSQEVRIESITDEDEAWGFTLYNPVKAEEFSNEELRQLLEQYENVPSFYFPKYYKSDVECFSQGEKTRITIDLKKDDDRSYNEIFEELEEFKKAKFFFLHFLKDKNECIFSIHIDDKTIKSKDDNWHIIDLKSKNKFSALHAELIEVRKNFNYVNIPDEPNIAIAFTPKNDENKIESKFYTYLPTKIECGFNILLHADFALDNARVSIPDNDYNNKILEVAAKLFVDELTNNENLHNRYDFAKFLLPNNVNDPFAKLVWKELIFDCRLTDILKNVFKQNREFPKSSYEMIFSVIKKWTREHNYGEEWAKYFNSVYLETIQYFCDDNIFIVYVDDTYKSFLPKKEKDEDTQKSKLFYIDEENDESKYDFNLLKQLSNITLSSAKDLKHDLFVKNGLVKENRNIEIYRTLAQEMENNITLSENNKLNILKFIKVNAKNEFNYRYFESDSKKDSADKQLSRILLPTKYNGWQPAKKCFINIDLEVASHFKGFFEVDYEKIEEIFPIKEDLKFFGVWDTLPITENFELPWEDSNVPKIQDKSFKKLLSRSISIWERIREISKPEIIKLFQKIKDQEVFYDEINKQFCKANEVFLFNDERKRQIISQAYKNDGFKELYDHLEIYTIEDTKNKDKLFSQLLKLNNYQYVIDKTHKTLYKQLVLSLSKCEDYIELNSIPLLIDDKYCHNDTNIWFADRNSKRYMHYFNTLNFILFDIETKQDFVRHFGVQLFDPNFELKPDSAKETIQSELKQIIEDQYLTHLFCLADEIMHINRFNKEEAITRWNNLKIGYSKDVWLEMSLNHSNEIVTVGKEIENSDVLFKPLSDSQRQQNKEKIGDIVHDLEGEPANIVLNPKFYKFGYVIADGVFRDTTLGSVLSDYLKTEDKNEFLKERGIIDSDINEMEHFIKQSILGKEEVEIIINKLNDLLDSHIVNTSNWFLLNTYLGCNRTYEEFKSLFQDSEKLQNVIKQLNPVNYNKSKMYSLKDEIKLKYYISHREQLTDEKFDQYVKSFSSKLMHYNFVIDMIIEHFRIDREISLDEIEIAKIEIANDITFVASDFVVSEPKVITSKQFEQNKKISTVKKRETTKLQESEKQQKRGLAYERIFALKQASKIKNNKNLFDLFVAQYRGINCLNQKVDFTNETLENITDIIQVSKSTGDGLGFDVLEIDSNGKINKVEIKSSRGNKNIHFSNNEIEQIFQMIDDPTWKLYHFVDEKIFDRTLIIKEEIKKLIETQKNIQSSIIAESWIITFE